MKEKFYIKSYACISDVRIRKIMKIIVCKKVIYSGTVNIENYDDFKLDNINYNLVRRTKSILNLIKSAYLNSIDLIKCRKGDVVYFVDEPIALVSIPMLLILKIKKVKLILDLFDSYYLKKNENIFIGIILKILYSFFDIIIVTDYDRQLKMNIISKRKIKVIQNFPLLQNVTIFKKQSETIRLFFYGALHNTRGWQFVSQFANLDKFEVIIAGHILISDLDKNNLPKNFKYLGKANNEKILNFMSENIDWVFCLYEPINVNNIFASPNKIYEALHTNCGIIISSETKISDFIFKNKFGLVINSYYDLIDNYLDILIEKNFCKASDELKSKLSFNIYSEFYNSL